MPKALTSGYDVGFTVAAALFPLVVVVATTLPRHSPAPILPAEMEEEIVELAIANEMVLEGDDT